MSPSSRIVGRMTSSSYRRTIWLSLLTTALAGGALYADTTDTEPAHCLNGEGVFGQNCSEMNWAQIEQACRDIIEPHCSGMVVRDWDCIPDANHPSWVLWCEWGN